MGVATNGASVDDRRDQRRRRGSDLSDKQIAHAAMRGRKVTFQYFSTQPAHELTGYIVGMDDYHWMVASVVSPVSHDDLIVNTLVHKSRVDMIRLHPDSTIDKETPEVQEAIRQVGQAFWHYCEKNYAGR